MNQDDYNIPLLTEVIPAAPQPVQPPYQPAYQPAYQPLVQNAPDYGSANHPGAFYSAPDTTSYQAPQGPQTLLPGATLTFNTEHLEQWQQEIHENVLQRLLTQADAVLQQQLQDQLTLAMDSVADILTQRIKESLRQALAETVSLAVAEEMARFTSSKK